MPDPRYLKAATTVDATDYKTTIRKATKKRLIIAQITNTRKNTAMAPNFGSK